MALGLQLIISILLAIQGADALQNSYDTDTEPRFAEAIPNITVAEGSDVTLPCVVDSLGKYKVAWIQLDQHRVLTVHYHTITNDPRISITARNNRIWSLQIRDVQLFHEGHYTCQVNTTPLKNNVVYLKVVVPPRIWVPDHQVAAAIQTDVVLFCNMECDPRSVMYWKRYDNLLMIVPSSKYNSVFLDAYYNVQMRLIIKNIGPEDFGSYTCVAKNSFGEAQGNITLYEMSEKVPFTNQPSDDLATDSSRVPPSIEIKDRRVGAVIGENVTLSCTVESHLSTMKYWIRETAGIILISNEKYNVNPIETDPYGAEMKLIIKDLEPDDFGSYICVSTNAVGETRATIALYEKDAPLTSAASDDLANNLEEKKDVPFTLPSSGGLANSSVEIPPKISIPNQQMEAAIGTEVTLVCDLESNPKSVIYWRRDGGGFMIIPNSHYGSHLIDVGFNRVQMILTIKNLGPDDFGSYVCVAKNSVGEDQGNITLSEIPKPRSSTHQPPESSNSRTDKKSPKIRIRNHEVGATKGAKVTLVCTIRSKTKAVTYWKRHDNGLMVIPNSKYNIKTRNSGLNKIQMRLTIKNLDPDDFGSYTCVAKNSLGEAERNITLYEKSEPHSSTYPSRDNLGSLGSERK